MRWEIIVFLVVFIIAIISKLISYRFNLIKIKTNGLKIIKNLAFIIGQYLGFLTGFGITMCFIRNDVICGISELNVIVIGLGILMMGVSLVWYFYSIVIDFYKLKKRKKNKFIKNRS